MAVDASPGLASARVILGHMLVHRHDYDNGLPELRLAVNIAPGMFEAQLLLGQALSQMSSHAEAAAHYRKCVELRPYDADTWLALAKALRAVGDGVNAIHALESALCVGPNDRKSEAIRLLRQLRSA